jgi:shikimate dehydrogenase
MTQMVGLIGWPVAHSRSPQMHNAAFAALGLDWRYVLLPTPPDQMDSMMQRLRDGELRGVNVTLPHKHAVLAYLDEIDSTAESVGAVNTIVVRGGRLSGHNTDVIGFYCALRAMNVSLQGRSCAVLGAGGSARAVLSVLLMANAHVTVYARDVMKARLALEYEGAVRRWSEIAQISPDTALIVNTTPIGMSPQVDASPWPDGFRMPAGALAFDLIYNPLRTRWMMQAERCGARSSNGLSMLVYQGAEAFKLWTGRDAPIDLMRMAVTMGQQVADTA